MAVSVNGIPNASAELTVPDPPTNLYFIDTEIGGGLAFAWTAPINNGGSSITDYILQYNNNTSNWITSIDVVDTDTDGMISGLDLTVKYSVRVLAVNSNGTSLPSNVVELVPAGKGEMTTPPPIKTPITFFDWCNPLKQYPQNDRFWMCSFDLEQMYLDIEQIFDDILNHETRITSLESISQKNSTITITSETVVERSSPYTTYMDISGTTSPMTNIGIEVVGNYTDITTQIISSDYYGNWSFSNSGGNCIDEKTITITNGLDTYTTYASIGKYDCELATEGTSNLRKVSCYSGDPSAIYFSSADGLPNTIVDLQVRTPSGEIIEFDEARLGWFIASNGQFSASIQLTDEQIETGSYTVTVTDGIKTIYCTTALMP